MMRNWLIRMARRWLEWLVRDAVILVVPRDQVYQRAHLLTRAQASYTDRSGEAKRHQVYAQLIKEFPDRARTELALAIEAAVR